MIKINPIQQKSKETPFFVWQNSWELRRYSDVPDNGPIPTELQRKLIHGYLASVSFIDEQVGRLIDHLQSFGQTENTVIYLWGGHGMFCKRTNYEQVTRSPLILVAPDITPAGTSTNAPTEFVDIYPTLCGLTNLEPHLQ